MPRLKPGPSTEAPAFTEAPSSFGEGPGFSPGIVMTSMALPTKIALNIVTPDQSRSFEVDEVVMPGQEGDFGVLPGHTPLFAGLRTGTMWYRQGAEKHFLAVSVGFAEVLPDRVTVLAQVAESAEDLDEARAEAGMARA